VKLTTHFHLAPMLRMNRATFLFPVYVFMAWTAIASFFYLPKPSDTHITASIGRKVKFILATGHEGPKGK